MKVETQEQFVIRWSDVLILNSSPDGEIDKGCFSLDYFVSTYGAPPRQITETDPARIIRDQAIATLKKEQGNDNYQLDPIVKGLISYMDKVRDHLLKENYIITPKHDAKWLLTEKGKLAKELGGHEAYKKFRRSEINLIRNQSRINILLIVATGLAAIMPFLAAWLFSTKVYNTNVLPPPVYRPDIRIDSVWLNQKVDEMIQKKLSNQQQEAPTKDKPPK